MANTLLALKADDSLKMKHKVVVVYNTSVQVIEKNEERRFLLIMNDGSEDVYIKFGEPAVVHEGIRINRGEGSAFSLCQTTMCNDEVNAIHSKTFGVALLITEGF